MTETTPHHFPQSIDARPLIASGALRGALIGFCWSLVVMVPLVWILWRCPDAGPSCAGVTAVAVCLIWSAITSITERWRTCEEALALEQRTVLRRHIWLAKWEAVCVALPGPTILVIMLFMAGNTITAPCALGLGAGYLAICIGSYLFVVIGHAKGKAAVRAMQRETRDAASRMDAHPLAVATATTKSTLVQPSKERFTEGRRGLDGAKSSANSRLDD